MIPEMNVVIGENAMIVIRQEIEIVMSDINLSVFREKLKYSKSSITDIWGYTNVRYESRQVSADNSLIASVNSKWQFTPDVISVACAYWCFSEESDATHFLMTTPVATRMYLWPKNLKFTVYNRQPT
jgi:hypothetical protein